MKLYLHQSQSLQNESEVSQTIKETKYRLHHK